MARAKNPGRGNGYTCEICDAVVSKVEIDHDVPCGSTPGSKGAPASATWDGFINRLFCSVDGLRAVCKPCHERITLAGRANAKNQNCN